MTAGDIAAGVLLVLAVLAVLAACTGAWRAESALDGQHFVSAAATVPPVLLAAAVIVREGFGTSAVLTLLAVLTLFVTGPAGATAFARAVTGEQGPQEADTDPEEAGS